LDDRKQSVVEIMAELEEKSKDIPGANIEFFSTAVPGYKLLEDLNFVY
jgi:HAE1 family hydrophobic/amphiphilic exporter-1